MKIYWVLMIATTMVAAFKVPSPSSVALAALRKLWPGVDNVNLLDGPYNISNAPIKTIKKTLPPLDLLTYYGYYASAAYCHIDLKTLVGKRIEKFKDDIVKIADFREDNLRCTGFVTLSEKRKEILMSFRGTSNIKNAALDAFAINVKTRSKREVSIHRGFYLAAMSLYKKMVVAVGYLRSLNEEYQNYQIVITGHSMGGAIARITQYYLNFLNQFPGVKYTIVTFGEPRTGNAAYADFMNKLPDLSVRVVNKGDPVSHVPPTSILQKIHKVFGDAYVHCLTEYWIDRKGGQRYCKQSMYEDRNCSMSLSPFYNPKEHSRYFDSTLKCVNKPEKSLSKSSWAKGIATLIKLLPRSPKKITDFSSGANYIRDV